MGPFGSKNGAMDTLVLGCTHYPFLTPLIERLAGPNVAVIDPSAAVARQVRRRLEALASLADEAGTGSEYYLTSGVLERTAPVMSLLLERPIRLEALPDALGQDPAALTAPAIGAQA